MKPQPLPNVERKARFQIPQMLGRLSQWVLGSLFVAAMLVGGGLFSFSSEPPTEKSGVVLEVATEIAVPQEGYEVEREFIGRVEARRQSQLGFERAGLVAAIRVDEGDAVAQGDVVAELDAEILTSQRSSKFAELETAKSQLSEMKAGPRKEAILAARAEVDFQKARVKLAEITKDRIDQLVKRRGASQQEFDEAHYEEASITAEWNKAKAVLLELENGTRREKIAAQQGIVDRLSAELETIDIQLKKSRMLAPYAGVIAERFLDEGHVIEAGMPIVKLLETGQLEARIGVTQDALQTLSDNSSTPSIWVDGKPYPAIWKAQRPERNQTTRTVSVLFSFSPGADEVFVGDLAAWKSSDTVRETGFWVPLSGLTESYHGLWSCYVAEPIENPSPNLEATHVLRTRELEILHQTTDRAFVRGSLQAGDAIVITGTQRLVPNQFVRLAK